MIFLRDLIFLRTLLFSARFSQSVIFVGLFFYNYDVFFGFSILNIHHFVNDFIGDLRGGRLILDGYFRWMISPAKRSDNIWLI